eukprot:456473-Rhodomonas_salina.2
MGRINTQASNTVRKDENGQKRFCKDRRANKRSESVKSEREGLAETGNPTEATRALTIPPPSPQQHHRRRTLPSTQNTSKEEGEDTLVKV